MRMSTVFIGLICLSVLFGCSRSGPTRCDFGKLSPLERDAMSDLWSVAVQASICKSTSKQPVSFDQVYTEGCVPQEGSLDTFWVIEGPGSGPPPLRPISRDPRNHPDYEFVFVDDNGQSPTPTRIEMNPRRAGLAGFLFQGSRLYCNARGKATAEHALSLGFRLTEASVKKESGKP